MARRAFQSDLLSSRRRRRRWPARLLGLVLVVLVAAAIATLVSTRGLATFGRSPFEARPDRVTSSPHWAPGGGFVNSEPTGMMKGGDAWGTAKAWLFGNELRVPSCPLPLFPDAAKQLAVAPASGLRVTWLGHSSVLFEIDGQRVLSDPMWSERASPSSWVGPRRFHPPPLPLDSLPSLDAVIISHDHYDHLDMDSIRALNARGVRFHVALGVGAHLERWGVPAAHIVEHDWWSSARLPGGLLLVATPGRHFSGRGLLSRNDTLWTSWALIGSRHRVFFSGDTGLHKAFESIAAKLGPFDLSLLEIGQYHPSWGDIHLGPRGALEAHRRLQARRLLPIHWGTFELGLHAWSEPAETLVTEAQRWGVEVLTPRLGEPVEPGVTSTAPWWRALPPMASACPPPLGGREK